MNRLTNWLIKKLIIIVLLYAIWTTTLLYNRVSSQELPPEETLVVKTVDSEITRLASVYGQNGALARTIIKCESEMYGGAVNHNKIGGVIWSTDIGVWQINDYFHKDNALKMGLDIYDEWDNLEYGFILLKSEGTKPWYASKGCWSST